MFNDALNTFYSRLPGVEHMVKVNPLPPFYKQLLLISSKDYFISTIPRENNSVGLSRGIDPATHRTTSGLSTNKPHPASKCVKKINHKKKNQKKSAMYGFVGFQNINEILRVAKKT